jgi:hypothetical protein
LLLLLLLYASLDLTRWLLLLLLSCSLVGALLHLTLLLHRYLLLSNVTDTLGTCTASSLRVWSVHCLCCSCRGSLRCHVSPNNDSSKALSSAVQQLLQLLAWLQDPSISAVYFPESSCEHCFQHLLPLQPLCLCTWAVLLRCKGLRSLLP